jgi:hypothetical protein
MERIPVGFHADFRGTVNRRGKLSMSRSLLTIEIDKSSQKE